eukprot:CCRYP_019748-RE/>CCRYP_019748-RE protein AED:0.48 eAED:0.82 QI:0/0/0/1/0/0/2/0/76
MTKFSASKGNKTSNHSRMTSPNPHQSERTFPDTRLLGQMQCQFRGGVGTNKKRPPPGKMIPARLEDDDDVVVGVDS